jgi:dephospho-CoA kinase
MPLLTIGLTGGAASGKSTLGAALSAAGFLVINCDKLWHKL